MMCDVCILMVVTGGFVIHPLVCQKGGLERITSPALLFFAHFLE